MSILKLHIFLCCLLGVLVLQGCTTALPDVSTVLREEGDASKLPGIEGGYGKLSAGRTEGILSRLERKAGPTDLLQANMVLMESLTGHPMTAGNSATLLIDGPATYAAMIKAITEARDHINLETFAFDDDDVGRRFSDLLLKKQAEGVQVNLMYDSLGCKDTPSEFFKRLKDAGVKVLEFNPINPLKLRKGDFVTHRDHRKVLVVDGKVGFAGGVNISSVFSGSSPGSNDSEEVNFGWRDTHVMIEGPAVAQLQNLFLTTWRWQKGPDITGRDYFPAIGRQGKELITIVGSTPGDTNRLTYVMYVASIKQAKRSILLTTAYFVPDEQMMKALTEAAERKVDVALLVPGVSDSTLALYAGRSRYEDLLEAGVRLFERRDRMLHSKTAVIDGVWSTIGSTNLDSWSFSRNNEINAIILGVEFAEQMEALMGQDMLRSDEITRKEWSRRPFSTRLKEWFARFFSFWL